MLTLYIEPLSLHVPPTTCLVYIIHSHFTSNDLNTVTSTLFNYSQCYFQQYVKFVNGCFILLFGLSALSHNLFDEILCSLCNYFLISMLNISVE